MKTRVNICRLIECPFSTLDRCERYAVALNCHLMNDGGVPRKGVYQGALQSQVWLFGNEDIDIEKLKADQQTWLESPDEAKRIEAINRREERMKV